MVSVVSYNFQLDFLKLLLYKKKIYKTKNVYGRWIWLDCMIFRAFAEWVLNNTYLYSYNFFFNKVEFKNCKTCLRKYVTID